MGTPSPSITLNKSTGVFSKNEQLIYTLNGFVPNTLVNVVVKNTVYTQLVQINSTGSGSDGFIPENLDLTTGQYVIEALYNTVPVVANFTVDKSSVSLRLLKSDNSNAVSTTYELNEIYKVSNSDDVTGVYEYLVYPDEIYEQIINNTFSVNVNSTQQLTEINGDFYATIMVKFTPDNKASYNIVSKKFLLKVSFETLSTGMQFKVYEDNNWINGYFSVSPNLDPSVQLNNLGLLICGQKQIQFRKIMGTVEQRNEMMIEEVIVTGSNGYSSSLEYDLFNDSIQFAPNPSSTDGLYQLRIKVTFEFSVYYYFISLNYQNFIPVSNVTYALSKNDVISTPQTQINLEYDRENVLKLQFALNNYLMDQAHANYVLDTKLNGCEIVSFYNMVYNTTMIYFEIINPQTSTLLERGCYEISRLSGAYGLGGYGNMTYTLPIEPRILLGNLATLNGQQLQINFTINNDCFSAPITYSYLFNVVKTTDLSIISPISIKKYNCVNSLEIDSAIIGDSGIFDSTTFDNYIANPDDTELAYPELELNDFYINVNGIIKFDFAPPKDYNMTYDSNHVVNVTISKTTSDSCNLLSFNYGPIRNLKKGVVSKVSDTIQNANSTTITFTFDNDAPKQTINIPIEFVNVAEYTVTISYSNKYYTTLNEVLSGNVYSGFKFSSNTSFIVEQQLTTGSPYTLVVPMGTSPVPSGAMDKFTAKKPLRLTFTGQILDYCNINVTIPKFLPNFIAKVGYQYIDDNGDIAHELLEHELMQVGSTQIIGNTFKAVFEDPGYFCNKMIKFLVCVDGCQFTDIEPFENSYETVEAQFPSNFKWNVNVNGAVNNQVTSVFEDNTANLLNACNITMNLNAFYNPVEPSPIYFDYSAKPAISDKVEIEVLDASRNYYSLGFLLVNPIPPPPSTNVFTQLPLQTSTFTPINLANLSKSSKVDFSKRNSPGYTRLNAGTYKLSFRLRVSCYENTLPIVDSGVCWTVTKKNISSELAGSLKLIRLNKYNDLTQGYNEYNGLQAQFGINDNIAILRDLTNLPVGTLQNPGSGFIEYMNSSIFASPKVPSLKQIECNRCDLQNCALVNYGHNQFTYQYSDINQTGTLIFDYNLSINQTTTTAVDAKVGNVVEYGYTIADIVNNYISYTTTFNSTPNKVPTMTKINGSTPSTEIPQWLSCLNSSSFGSYTIYYKPVTQTAWIVVDDIAKLKVLNTGSYAFEIKFSGLDTITGVRQWLDSVSNELIFNIKPRDNWTFGAQFITPTNVATNYYTYKYYKQNPQINAFVTDPNILKLLGGQKFNVVLTAVSTNPIWSKTVALANKSFVNGVMTIMPSEITALYAALPSSSIGVTLKIQNNNFNMEINAGTPLIIENRPLEVYASFLSNPINDPLANPLLTVDTNMNENELKLDNSGEKYGYIYLTFNYDPIEIIQSVSNFNITFQGKNSYKIFPSENLSQYNITPSKLDFATLGKYSKVYQLRVGNLQDLLKIMLPGEYNVAVDVKFNTFGTIGNLVNLQIEAKLGIDINNVTYPRLLTFNKQSEIPVTLSSSSFTTGPASGPQVPIPQDNTTKVFTVEYNPYNLYTLTYNFNPNVVLNNGEQVGVSKGYVQFNIKSNNVAVQESHVQVNNSVCAFDIHALPIGSYSIISKYTDFGEGIYSDTLMLPQLKFNIVKPSTINLLVSEFTKLDQNKAIYIEIDKDSNEPTIPIEGELMVDLSYTLIEDGMVSVYDMNDLTTVLASQKVTTNNQIKITLGHEILDNNNAKSFAVRFTDLSISPSGYFVQYVINIPGNASDGQVFYPTQSANPVFDPSIFVPQPIIIDNSNNVLDSIIMDSVIYNRNLEGMCFSIYDAEGRLVGSQQETTVADLESILNEMRGSEDNELVNRIKSLESLFFGLQLSTNSKDMSILEKVQFIENKLKTIEQAVPVSTPAPAPTPAKKPTKKPTRKPALKKNNKPKTSATKNLVGVKVMKK